nr:MAG TPA: hypothetical protein [Caudoviricetes sp.]
MRRVRVHRKRTTYQCELEHRRFAHLGKERNSRTVRESMPDLFHIPKGKKIRR